MEIKNVKTILMMGKTGSGKGMQAGLLSKETGYKIFSSGDKFRELRQREDWLGERVREEYDQGLLMPHWFASYIFEEALFGVKPEDGLIFEGTGRKKSEAELFNEVVTWLHREYLVFDIQVSDEEVLKRLQLRGRSDGLDANVEKIKFRLDEYRKHTGPAIALFKSYGRVVEINGEQTPEAVHTDIVKALGL
ncbi:MAG: nucleoside monophosphate kinase [Candidatus Taylorbacteria bacterium]|nr:nucleoside monophosphate kinase [Candidatus Taylorbacteria bacterium]